MAPPFVACRICYTVEGKLKNYKGDEVYVKAYEKLTGYRFEDLLYLSKFCPSCACMLKKVSRFIKKCRHSHYWMMDYLNTGRKISQPYIRRKSDTTYNLPVVLSTWNSKNATVIDCVHTPKRYKPKPKEFYEIGVSHLAVPKDPAEESFHFRQKPRDPNDDFWDDDDLDSEFEDESERELRLEGERVRAKLIQEMFRGAGEVKAEASVMEGAILVDDERELDVKPETVPDPDMRLETDPDPDMRLETDPDPDMTLETDPDPDVTLETDPDPGMRLETDPDPDMKSETDPEPDQDNLPLQQIKDELQCSTEIDVDSENVQKGKRKKSTKKNEKQPSTDNPECLTHRAKRQRSNQELEEHFTITAYVSEEEQMQEFLKRRETESYLEGRYKCELCLKSFKEQKWMDTHVKKHESPAGSYICEICKIRCRTPKLFRTHRDANHTTKYACNRCAYHTFSKAQALKHHGWHEGVEHSCQHCGATFRKHTTYMGHLRRAHPSSYICGVCARSFVSAYGLNLHIKAVHKDINKLENDSTKCEECDVTFVSHKMYIRHILISDKHKDMANDIVRWCGKNSKTSNYKKDGITFHRLGCRKCGEQFESKEDMERHTHYKERKYVRKADAPKRNIKCDECEEVFTHPNGVYQHYLREHPDKPYQFAIQRHYLCEQCGKTFKSPGLLQQHGLIHKGLRPPAAKKQQGRNSCRLCGKTYSKLSGLFRHKLTHLGVRRHKCHICEKAFTDTSNLKQHVQGVHLNIRRVRKR